MRQFLIFIVGALSMFIAVAGIICGIQAIATSIGFLVLCGILFLIVWTFIAVVYFRGKYYEKIVANWLGE